MHEGKLQAFRCLTWAKVTDVLAWNKCPVCKMTVGMEEAWLCLWMGRRHYVNKVRTLQTDKSAATLLAVWPALLSETLGWISSHDTWLWQCFVMFAVQNAMSLPCSKTLVYGYAIVCILIFYRVGLPLCSRVNLDTAFNSFFDATNKMQSSHVLKNPIKWSQWIKWLKWKDMELSCWQPSHTHVDCVQGCIIICID